jgi:hypothetical protein
MHMSVPCTIQIDSIGLRGYLNCSLEVKRAFVGHREGEVKLPTRRASWSKLCRRNCDVEKQASSNDKTFVTFSFTVGLETQQQDSAKN